ncbi:MAG TPA: hypothetical protein VK716_03085 [Terracidiphilus sp.]|jgi:hypothetical protein|nr:hypothetical protein [Terracidiphilus sp.]
MKFRGLALLLVVAYCVVAAYGDSLPKPGLKPVQAELIADLNARLLQVGSTVFARVTADWQSADCALKRGSILEASVLSVAPHTKTSKSSELALAFTQAQCGEAKMVPFKLMLAAMAAPTQDSDLGILNDTVPFLIGSGAGAISAVKSMQFSATGEREATNTYTSPFPAGAPMHMGEVIGIRRLRLDVGTGAESSSVLTSNDRDISLDKHTALLLVPTLGTIPRVASSAGAAQPLPNGTPEGGAPGASAEAAQPAVPELGDADVCAPPECSVALPSVNAMDVGNTLASISIRQLGFSPRPPKMIERFDNDEALAYLGPRELLVAFNPHILAHRHYLGKSGWTVRVIRAALMDTTTHQVTRTVDWDLSDNGQFLWPLPDGRVLVHAGSELRIYGEGLKIQNRISLDGPLAFVRVTPDGSFLAIGVIHEKHSPELHAQLKENLNEEPAEDVSIAVLNRNLDTIAKSSAQSNLMAPTLLNEGQATLLAQPHGRYRILMRTWDDRSWTIARFTSTCTPEMSSLSPNLLFLVSCEGKPEGREFRVLHTDGKLALKGVAMPNECGQGAAGSANREAYVVKVVQSSVPTPPDGPFSTSEFTGEELRVYRAVDGRRLLGVRVGHPSASRDGYALAPDGSQLAVLDREEIAVYSVPEK